ncbi:MAG: dTDP-4-dehydrorhamnose reductase [Bacteroidales bacterium]|nr:dTDP-4-dehydrorhamnose reductase [Bacteroidales bacterium]
MTESLHILVTGGDGQLGRSLKHESVHFPSFQLIFTDLDDLDITNEKGTVTFLKERHFDAVINCASYTAVDRAEEEQDICHAVNAMGAGILARASSKHQIPLIHISTDYVFSGNQRSPYSESGVTVPLSVYGRSKLEGEQLVTAHAQSAVILRTSWLYSEYGSNFVRTILRLCIEREEIKVVNDQYGSPTYARDLALAILQILPEVIHSPGVRLFHYSNTGSCSRYEFAEAIRIFAGLPCRVTPVPTSAFPTAALRPPHAVLDTRLIRSTFGITIPRWPESLKLCISRIEK